MLHLFIGSIGKLLQTECVVSFAVVVTSLIIILGERKRGEYLFKLKTIEQTHGR